MGVPAAPRYHAYKESDEAWIAEIPAHWKIRKLKHLFVEKKHRANMALGCGSISFGEVVFKPDEKITEATKASYQEVLAGEFLINPLNLNYDLKSLRIALSEIDVVVSAGYIVLLDKDLLEKRYFKYLLHRYDVAYLKLLGSGVRQTISFTHIANSLLVAPPIEEQKAIVRFLDEKTAKIDEAIAIEERQIALLKERKQIVIQNAVTQGLNPNAPMKDSGVDWIGEIPAHWEVRRNAAIFEESKSSGNASLPVLSVSIHSGVSDRELSDEENIRSAIKIEDRTAYKEVRPGFVTYNMMRAWQGGIGAVRTLGMVSPAYVVLAPKIALDSEYFEYLYRTPAFVWQMDCNSKGITDFRKRLYWEEFKTLVTLLPPVDEQSVISAAIRQQADKVDGGIVLKQQQIAVLKEYKATLINSAVTGKIKVA
jgi:type I restriction enzyme S subunit